MTLRSWATPVTIGAFLAMGVTGLLMFFHLNTGLNKGLHEWAGLAMVAAVLAHLVLNWRAFTTYFSRPAALAFMGAFALLLAGSFLPLGDSEGGPESVMNVVTAVAAQPVEVVAGLAGKTSEQAIAALAAQGVTVTAGQSVASVTGDDPRAARGALAAVFAE